MKNLRIKYPIDKECKAPQLSRGFCYHHLKCRCENCITAERLHKREWRRKNVVEQNAHQRKHYHENKDKYREWQLRQKYGLELGEYQKIYEKQLGKCRVCLIPFEVLFVDHSHEHNHVRRSLSTHCHTGLGQFKDSVEMLRRAIQYIN